MPREADTPKRTREQELRNAIAKAGLLPRDFKVYIVLLDKTDHGIAKVNRDFPIRGIADLSGRCEMSPRGVLRALRHLAEHGWVNLARGWRDPLTYQPLLGLPCQCRKRSREPLTGAERTRRWRERRASCDGKMPSRDDKVPSQRRQNAVTVTAPRVTQSQVRGHLMREGTEGEGRGGGGPPARIPGVRGDIIPADPATRDALRVLVDALGPVTIIGETS
jgi:predicted DNA-binding transcriptional regulator